MSVFRRFANLFSRTRLRREIEDELAAHLAMRTEDNLAAGMNRREALRDARLRFGNPAATREHVTATDASLSLGSLTRDVRYALRQLHRSPGFTLTAVVTLALGIGANIAVFGVLNALILQPVRVAHPESLFQVVQAPKMWGGPSYPAFSDFQERNTSFSGMAGAYGMSAVGLHWRNSVRKVWGYDVTGNYFDLLGIQPELGRFFHAADEHGPDSAPYIVLGDALWHSEFQADPGVIGTTVELNKHPFTILGIAPPEFHGTERFLWPDYWVPIVNEQQVEGWDFLHDRVVNPITALARLKPGVTVQQATDNLNALAREMAKEHPATDKDLSARLIRPGLEGDNAEVIQPFLLGVMVLAILVLAAACANLAGLFAARTADRNRELALRLALGSSRVHLLRQLLTEAVLVSLAGGCAGALCAGALLALLARWQPFGDGAEHLLATPNVLVYAAAFLLSLASGLIFGLLPTRQLWQSSPMQAIKNAPLEGAIFRHFALRDILLGMQIAICTLLVTASLVAVQGMERALHAPLGIQPQGVMVAQMDLGMIGQGGDPALAIQKRMIDAVANIPGVTAVGDVSFAPLSGAGMSGIPVYRPGTAEFALSNMVLGTRVYAVSPGYLRAAGTRLFAGRDLTWNDKAKAPWVAIVNQTFAHSIFGTAPAIGQRFVMWGNTYEVIGVAEDGKYLGLTESPQPAIYVSLAQVEQSNMNLIVRSERAPSELASALQRALKGIEPNLPLTIRSWPEILGPVLLPARAATVALGVMGLLAALLAVTGIFGMAAYSVSKRRKELGIRVALGAQRVQLIRSALGRPLTLLLAGSALGLTMGLLATRQLERIVYQANPHDPLVLGGVIATMALLGLIATWIPAQRALGIDPSKLMHEE